MVTVSYPWTRPLPVSRPYITAPCGLRLVELQDHDNGTVVHHWEFLNDDPPTEFKVNPGEVKDMLPCDSVELSLLVEDSCGNVTKHRLCLDDLLAPTHQ